MKKMKCYDVTLEDLQYNGIQYHIGVACYNIQDAMQAAEKSLYEGRHIRAYAQDVKEVDAI